MKGPSLALRFEPSREVVERDLQRCGALGERAEAAALAARFDLAQARFDLAQARFRRLRRDHRG